MVLEEFYLIPWKVLNLTRLHFKIENEQSLEVETLLAMYTTPIGGSLVLKYYF